MVLDYSFFLHFELSHCPPRSHFFSPPRLTQRNAKLPEVALRRLFQILFDQGSILLLVL